MTRWLIREVAIFGLCGGVLILALRLAQYRFVVVEPVHREFTPEGG